MISDNTVNGVVNFLNLYSNNMHQYKEFLFKLFVASYRNGEFDSIETVREAIYYKISKVDEGIKDRVMSEFTSMWDEWRYAFYYGMQNNHIKFCEL